MAFFRVPKYRVRPIEVKKLPYPERLKKLELPSLEYRRFRGDLIQVYKIAQEKYDRISTNTLIQFNPNPRLRGHQFKITKSYTNKKQYQHFFSNRIVNQWNSLPADIVNSESIDAFKNSIDKKYKDLMYTTNLSDKIY